MAHPDFDDYGEPANAPAEAPHAVDAERAVLGALLLNNELLDEAEALAAEHFYDKRHRVLFAAVLRLAESGHADPVVVAHHLDGTGELASAGGKEYIAELAAIGAAPVNMPAYVRLIREAAHRRRLLAATNENAQAALHPGESDADKLQDESEARLLAVGDDFERGAAGPGSIKTFAHDYFNKITDVINSQNFDKLRGIDTGLPTLTRKTNGFHSGDLVILAGRPGTGKTALALNMMRAASAAKNKAAVLMFSLEMNSEALTMRMLAQDRLDLQKLRAGKHGGEQLNLADLSRAVSELEKRELYFDDSGALNIWEAKARARRLRRRLAQRNVRLGLVVVDYLQLMTPPPGTKKSDTRAEEVAAISRGLKAMAKELDAPVLALSQLNRAVESRADKKPALSDLRDSGAIEQDADLILFLHPAKEEIPPGAHDAPEAPDGVDVILEIGKQRNGPVGKIPVKFQKRFSRFGEPAEPNRSGGDF